MRILVPLSKIPKYRSPLMELMLKIGSSKMISCRTGRKPVHWKLGETIPEPCKISQHLLWIFGANMSLFMFQETSMLPGGPGICLYHFRAQQTSSTSTRFLGYQIKLFDTCVKGESPFFFGCFSSCARLQGVWADRPKEWINKIRGIPYQTFWYTFRQGITSWEAKNQFFVAILKM